MNAQDRCAVVALRCALAAIDNAEAVDLSHAPRAQGGPIAHAVSGVRSGDVSRHQLSQADMIEIVHAEVVERIDAAAVYDQLGQSAAAAQLREEAATLANLIDVHETAPDSPACC
jgi:uncharacterized protein YqeY